MNKHDAMKEAKRRFGPKGHIAEAPAYAGHRSHYVGKLITVKVTRFKILGQGDTWEAAFTDAVALVGLHCQIQD